ncbi:hypothetical protein Ddye_029531 [Dipteronia dyeriana]|uniref:Uncharacterized protein n=1 Tax=Dipteronia dyeriana TaxID=168575 RepID=A0AAD9WKN7_9ROSI|nr:hypothetical protein Ddye_029531 [Dipteronia dyeriana]
MAFRGYWRSMVSRLGGGNGNRSFATSNSAHANHSYNKYAVTGEFAPVYMVLGLLTVALTIGTHTAKQQLVHCPNVSVSKKKRRSLSEVEDPDRAVNSSDKFLNKSFLRKMANIQEHNRVLPDSARPDPFTAPRKVETLKTVGVNPSRH